MNAREDRSRTLTERVRNEDQLKHVNAPLTLLKFRYERLRLAQALCSGVDSPRDAEGDDIDRCIAACAEALRKGPLALGFEAPMFVPMRHDPSKLTRARDGECGDFGNRPFSAGAGATVLVTGLVVVSYVLSRLRAEVSGAQATLDWRAPFCRPGQSLVFEAFVSNQPKSNDPRRHIQDARLAVAAFKRGILNASDFRSAVNEATIFNLLGAILLRCGWTAAPTFLSAPCLVVRV